MKFDISEVHSITEPCCLTECFPFSLVYGDLIPLLTSRFYHEQNKVSSLLKIPRKDNEDQTEKEALMVADDSGTLRIFEYPCHFSGPYHVYTQHLNYINSLRVSTFGDYLISSSIYDKATFIWKINRHHSNDFKAKSSAF